MRSPACWYSFNYLYEARFDRAMTDQERENLYALSQEDRNRKVGEWAKECGWITEDVVGDDGVTYRSFMPRTE